MDLATAYRTCERITRIRARNFYYGIRLLPPSKRRGLCSVYAFARRVDDVGDGPLPDGEKLGRLDSARADLLRLGQAGDDPVMFALSDACERFDLPVGALGDLVDGVEMDVRGTRYERFDDLEVYCRRVAGSIGRLSVAVFGPTDREGATALADDLGVAMQLTNILETSRRTSRRVASTSPSRTESDSAGSRGARPVPNWRRSFGSKQPGPGTGSKGACRFFHCWILEARRA